MTCVQAPASSANLGPGFDVLGLAINRYARANDEGNGDPCGPDHIARVAYSEAGGTNPIWFDFDFAPGRGLGFSAAARTAGAALAFAQQGMTLAEVHDNTYSIVAQLEGHGDNAAPAVFGGVHVIAGDVRHRVPVSIPGEMLFWVPEHDSTPTDQSRLGMPTTIERSDAVFNLGRMGLLMAALYEGNIELLQQATEDRIHQPRRLAASPPSAEAYRAALDADVAAAWLSGSGPTIAMICRPGTVESVIAALPDGGDVERASLDLHGVVVREHC